MPEIKPFTGQNNMDLNMNAYGSMDNYIKFCKDNNISDTGTIKKENYYYDKNFIVNKINCGYPYTSGNVKGFFFGFVHENSTDSIIYYFSPESIDAVFVPEN